LQFIFAAVAVFFFSIGQYTSTALFDHQQCPESTESNLMLQLTKSTFYLQIIASRNMKPYPTQKKQLSDRTTDL
jgi:hypothetical protein